MRLLPPGTFSDYLALFHEKHTSDGVKVSLKLFISVWADSFADLLAIRQQSQHATCASCIRHKMLLRKLCGDKHGREAQMQQYVQHLRRQYADRAVYWSSRAVSRLKTLSSGLQTICMVVDAMDHSKYRYPRSIVFSSKEFSGFIRPAMDMHCCIIHGHDVVLALSEPFLPKDSNWCSDLVSHCLHRLSEHTDLRCCELILQCDNTTRECKNNTLMRLLSAAVGSHRLRRAELRCLQSGHSHEDVDQVFSYLASFLEAHKELHTPADFKQLLETWLSNPEVRPNEPRRVVHLVGAVRNWRDHLHIGCCGNNLVGVGGPGAPHTFAFDRAADLPGILRNTVKTSFWDRMGVPPDSSDVVLRTKQWMSDESFRDPILYLPAAVLREMAATGAVPGGQDPFNMHAAACHLERLARGAVPNALHVRAQNLKKQALGKYRASNRSHHIHVAAARLWAEGVQWQRAIDIVTEAFDAATYEEEKEKLDSHKSIDAYFTHIFSSKEKGSYAVPSSLQSHGGILLRPWQLFLTDADVAGVEKLAVSSMRPDLGCKPPFDIAASEIDPVCHSLLGAQSVFMVKGSFATVHATVAVVAGVDDPSMLVQQNRGITLGSSIRRRPNAFNLLHQIRLLSKMGKQEDSLDSFNSAAQVAQAYQIGIWGMGKFMTHEPIAAGAFNHDWCSAGPLLSSWSTELTNTFMMKHADAELTAMLEETVPPVDLSRIGSFRAVIQKYQKQAEDEKVQAAEQSRVSNYAGLAQQWASATFQQAEAKMKADLEQMQLYLTASQENANRQAPMWLALGAWLSVFCLILFCGCVRALWT
ncbi:unnamed protein product [Effrenium voratum]|nr:unnamed protein product [Effrenium voratum]